ncbi:hypothetical protein [Anaeroarcus burkinensis]|uniref:hypothetical protein n=1 Tax=Anaeroarcus burkinensis TaxID=82376 RepID=UPI0004079446|nr:hypothetical protein [Anaeroarcus burkinensis]
MKSKDEKDRTAFHLVLAVWGEAYVRLFLNVSLPSLLASGNLPELYSGKNSIFIYTRSEDKKYFESNRAFFRLKEFFVVTYIDIESEFSRGHSWSMMTSAHNHAVKLAFQKGVSLIFLIPDFVYSKNSFARLLELYDQGYRAVLVLTLAAKRDVFLDEYLNLVDEKEHIVEIEPRDLLLLWQKYRHPVSDFYCCNLTHFPNKPPCAFGWQIDRDTFIARSSQFTPFLIQPEQEYQLRNDEECVETVDTVLVKNVVTKEQSVYIVADSDELVQIEMRPATEEYSIAYDRPNIPMLALCLNQFRINGNGEANYLEQKICIHSGDTSKDILAMQQADQMYERIKALSIFANKEEFLGNLRKYFNDIIKDRMVMVIGSGYIAEATVDFFKVLGFAVKQTSNLSEHVVEKYVVLANETVFEKEYFYLTMIGMKHELDFIRSPLIYRYFRVSVFEGYSWKKIYYNYCYQYADSLTRFGFLWAIKRAKQKINQYLKRRI